MPDNTGSFLTELTEATSLGNDDLLYAVKYENGTPVSRKVRKSTVLADAVKDVKVNGRTAVNENKEAELYISYIKNEVSGDICSFDDAEAFPVDALKVAIEPQQDLHGYDAPWVGGAGKNKFDKSTVNVDKYIGADGQLATSQYNQDVTDFIPVTSGQSYIINSSISTNHYSCFYDANKNVIGSVFANNQFPKVAPSDAKYIRVTFSKADVDTFMVEQGTTASSTYYPYFNICPISGWDECNVSVSGVNIWDEEWEVGGLNPLNGETTSENNRIRSKNYRPCKPNMTMFYYIPSGKGNLQIVFYDINKNYLGYYNFTTEHTFTTPNGCCFFKFNTGGSYGTTYNNDISINYPSTDTSYHAYNGSTYTIDLDGTRYGGTLDVVSGVLTITHKIVDLGTLTWGKSSLEATIIYISIQDKKMGVNPILCSSYKYESDKGFGLNFGAISDSSNQTYINYVFVRNQDFSGKTDLECKTAMNGVQAVYELATPQSIQLTPTQVFTLLGLNNVWADTGEIKKLVYIQDKSDTLNELLDRADETDADIKNLQDNLLNKSIMSMNFDRIDLSYLASIGTVQYNKNLRWFNSSYTPVIQDGDDIVVDVPVQAIKDLGIQVLTWTRGMSTQSFIWYTTNVGGYNNSSVTQILVSNISDYATRLCIALNKNNPYILVQADMKNVTRSTDIFHWIRNNDIPDGEISLQKINGALNVEITVGIFDKMVFVGDSFTGGAIVKPDSSWSTVGDRTWGQLICKRNGIEAGVFGVGGATTRSYLSSGLPLVLADTAGDFYMFALGLNDNSSLGSSYIGTVSDIKADYTQNPDTFYGNYARIIEQVMAHAPKARFCMVKMQTHSGSWSDFNTAIQTIAEHYEIPWIDPYDDVFFTSSVYRTMVGGHPTLLGYNGMSLAYERLLSQCFMDNQVYFRYAGINIS